MKRLSVYTILFAFALLFAGADPASAQNFQGLNLLQNIATEGQGAGKYVVNIAFVFSGVAGALLLIPAGIKAFKGEPQTKDAVTNVGLTLIAIFIFLAIIKAVFVFV